MSIDLMAAIWKTDADQLKGSARLLMLAIADNANDDGYSRPGIDHLSKKTGIGNRQIMRLIKKCEKEGWLKVERSPNKVNRYHLCLDKIYGSKGDILSPSLSGDILSPEIVGDNLTPTTSGDNLTRHGDNLTPTTSGDNLTRHGDIAMSPDPIINNKRTNSKKNNLFKTLIEQRIEAVAEVCRKDLSIPDHRRIVENKAVQLDGYTPDFIKHRYGQPNGSNAWNWYRDDWRGKKGQLPTPALIVDTITHEKIEVTKDGQDTAVHEEFTGRY